MKNLLLIIVTISTLTGKSQGFGQLALGTSGGAGNSTSGTQEVVNTGQSTVETNFTPDYSVVEETPATVVTLQGLESRITVLSEIFNHRIGKLNKNAVVYADKKDVGYGPTKDYTNVFVNGKYITSIQISNVLYAKIEAERKNPTSNVQVGRFIPDLCVAQSAQVDGVIAMLPEVAAVTPNSNNEGVVTNSSGSTTTIINNYYTTTVQEPVDNDQNPNNVVYYQQQPNVTPAEQVVYTNTTNTTEPTWWQRHGDALVAGAVGFGGGYLLGNYTPGGTNTYTTYGGSIPTVGGSNVIGTTTTGGTTLIGGSNTGN